MNAPINAATGQRIIRRKMVYAERVTSMAAEIRGRMLGKEQNGRADPKSPYFTTHK